MKKKTGYSNLYKFIRLVMGKNISDKGVANKWNMDGKNFHDIKTGIYPVPRIERLVSLSKVLKVHEYVIFEVAKGMPAQKAYSILKKFKLVGKDNKFPANMLERCLSRSR